MFYFLVIILAFCSIVYELLLGQLLSAFLGNTILRYSVTIGLYMCFKGVGALCAVEQIKKKSISSLQIIELLLTTIGFLCIPFLFAIDWIVPASWTFTILAHLLIAIIGFLTGLELPLLIQIVSKRREYPEAPLIAMDYIGAFLGTFAFAFYFYPTLGVIQSLFLVSTLNALCGISLTLARLGKIDTQERFSPAVVLCQAVVLGALVSGSLYSTEIDAWCHQLYLGSELGAML